MPPSRRGRQEKEGRPNWGAEGSKKGRTLLPNSSTAADEGEDEWLPRAKPRGDRKYSDARVIHSIPLSHCFS